MASINSRTRTIVERKIKLMGWGDGPWLDEPDIITGKYKKYSFKIKRNLIVNKYILKKYLNEWHKLKKIDPENPILRHGLCLGLGHLCGYIQIKKTHPWFELEYDNIRCEVHGGLTYKEESKTGAWIGFDCAHWDDVTPSLLKNESLYQNGDSTYKTVDFVQSECIRLIDQATEVLTEEKN